MQLGGVPPGAPGAPGGIVLPGGTADNPLAMGGNPNPPLVTIPLNQLRQVSIRNLEQTRQSTVPVSVFGEVDCTNLISARERLKPLAEQRLGLKLTYLPFFARAVIKALQQNPIMNSALTATGHVIPRQINLGIATHVPGAVLIPTVMAAERLGFWDLARAIDLQTRKAKAGQLTLAEMALQTFVISNTGSFGGDSLFGTPVLLPTNTGSIAFETIRKRPVVMGNDQLVVRPMMYLSMTADHRSVDGSDMIRMLGRVKECLEKVEMS